MAIFVRRAVQRAFAHLKRHVLTSEQADYLVRRLNSGIDEALHTEWEVIVIAAFAKQGSVVYERPFAIGAMNKTWAISSSISFLTSADMVRMRSGIACE